MTPQQRVEINTQNAQHSTGPKTDEGKAKSSQNAVTHGLTSSTLPRHNPKFLQKLAEFQTEFPLPNPGAQILIQEISHLAIKLEQIPQIEYEIELNSPLTLAEHFMQDKPTPLTRLWNLELRLQGRFNSLYRKLTALKKELQNEPTTPQSLPPSPPPTASSRQSKASPLQNKPTAPPPEPPMSHSSIQKLLAAVNAVPLDLP